MKTKMPTAETQIPISAEQIKEVPRHEMDLQAGVEYRLDAMDPLVTEGEFKVSAVISAMGGENEVEKAKADGENPDQWLILDLRDAPRMGKSKIFQDTLVDSSVDYMLVTDQFDLKAGTGFKGIRRGETIAVGRDNAVLDERFGGFAETTSRRHFNIALSEDGQLTIKDLHSTNGTRVITSQQPVEREINSQYAYNETTSGDNNDPTSADGRQAYEANNVHNQNEQIDMKLVRRAADLRKGFFDVVEASDAVLVAEQLRDAEREGLSPQQIRRLMVKNWHPDSQLDPKEQQRYQEIMKMINASLDEKR